jgi:hypothetical protein
MGFVRLFGIVLLLGLTMPAHADETEAVCPERIVKETCSRKALAAHRNAFGLAALDQYRGTQTVVVRVFRLDGWSNRGPLLVFIREPWMAPRLEVRRQLRWDSSYGDAPMLATLSDAAWREVVENGKRFDAKFEENDDWICTDTPTIIVEMIDEKGVIRQRADEGCRDEQNPVAAYFTKLVDTAVDALPACKAVEPGRAWYDYERLSLCLFFDGDRMAAAELHNLMEGADFRIGVKAAKIEHLFHEDVEMKWPGTVLKGSAAVTKFWAEQDLRYREIYGETPDRVRIHGSIQLEHKEAVPFEGRLVDETKYMPFIAKWNRDVDGKLKMTNIEFNRDRAWLSRSRHFNAGPVIYIPKEPVQPQPD